MKQTEEELGVLGPPISTAEYERIVAQSEAKEVARRELFARMAANMIVDDKPRSYYFVREPGL